MVPWRMPVFAILATLSVGLAGAPPAAGATPAPAAPVGLRVPALAYDAASITLVWEKPREHADVVDYHVYRDGRLAGSVRAGSGSPAEPYLDAFAADPANASQVRVLPATFTATGLRPRHRYTFTVRSVDVVGRESRDSAPVTRWTSAVSRVFNVRDFGAVGDGSTPDTAAIQAAIDACSPGGTVLVPAGTFLTGALWLKSEMTLAVAAGATLLGSPEAADYPYGFRLYDYSTDQRFFSLINAHTYDYGTLHDIRVVGAGTIDGNGWRQGPPDADGFPVALPSSSSTVDTNGILARSQTALARQFGSASPYGTRSNLITLRGVRNVYLGGFTAVNPAQHDLVLLHSDNVTVAGVRMLTQGVNNGDGIDFAHGSGLTVIDNVFDTGDDGMNFAAGLGAAAAADPPTRDAWIAGNYFRHGHGAVVTGSHTGAWIEDIVAEDNVVDGTDVALRMKTDPNNGGGARRVRFRDTAVKAVTRQAIILTSAYSDPGAAIVVEPSPVKARFTDVTVTHITVDGTGGDSINVLGVAGAAHGNLRLSDVRFLHARPASIRYLSGASFHDVVYMTTPDPWSISDSTGLVFSGTTTVSATTADAGQGPRWPDARLAVSGVDDVSATLSWTPATDNAGVATYSIMDGDTTVATVPGTGYEYRLTGLSPGLRYRLHAVAADATGNRVRGPTVVLRTSGTVATVPPVVPTGPDAVRVTAGSVGTTWMRLAWQPATGTHGVSRYLVEANGRPAGGVPGDTLTFTATGLRPGTRYTFTVVAVDASGNRATYPARPVAVTAPPYDRAVPSWPPGGRLTATAVGPTDVSLRWTPARDDRALVGYRLYLDGVPVPGGAPFTPVNTASTTAGTSYRLTGLRPHTTYLVTVSAGDSAGKWTRSALPLRVRTS
ncbi:MAG: exo-poly-alpha-galacturonosidase [Micromonosporaceae bacterium]